MRGDPSQTHQPPQNGTAHSGVLLSARAPRRKCTSQVHAPTSAAAACREPAARLPSPPASPPLPLSVTTPCSAPASSTHTRRAKEACSKAPAPASRSRTPTSRGRASLRLCVCGTLPSWGKARGRRMVSTQQYVVFIFLPRFPAGPKLPQSWLPRADPVRRALPPPPQRDRVRRHGPARRPRAVAGAPARRGRGAPPAREALP